MMRHADLHVKPAMTQTVHHLPEEERLRLEAQRKWVREHYEQDPVGSYSSLKGKLSVLNAILSNGWVGADETVKLQSLGVAFGDALAQQLEMEWVQVTDEYGTDPALRLPGTSVLSFPLTSISKRIERGENVDVYRLFKNAYKTIIDAKNAQA